jgi:hypothetical protein
MHNAPMTALERLVLTFMQIPMAEDRRMELHKRVKEAAPVHLVALVDLASPSFGSPLPPAAD